MPIKSFGERQRVKQHVGEKSRVKKNFRAQCDINEIMARYFKTGLLEHVERRQGQYGEFHVMPDFHTAMTKVAEAQAMFLELPASIRARFGNDPGAFLDFVSSPDNIEEMRKIGLLPKAPPPAPDKKEPPSGGLPRGERASGGGDDVKGAEGP